MIYLFHGENQAASRKALTDLRSNCDSSAIKILSGDSLVELIEACESRALFSPRLLVVSEVPDARRLTSSKDVLDYLRTTPRETDLAFWVGGVVRKNHPLLKLIKDVGDVKYFGALKEKPFSFLDALGEKNLKKAYTELEKLCSNDESEIGLLQLVVWEVRNLVRAKTCQENQGMNPYVFRKMVRCSRNFSEERLVVLFGKVFEADVAMKTGLDPRLVLDRLVYEIVS